MNITFHQHWDGIHLLPSLSLARGECECCGASVICLDAAFLFWAVTIEIPLH